MSDENLNALTLKALKTVSIVVPFFNESEGIDVFYHTLCKHLSDFKQVEFEVVCVDDGSSDNTLALLLELARQDSRFVVIELTRNFGKEAALTAGIETAIGDAVIPIDSDLQDPPELITKSVLPTHIKFLLSIN